MDDSSPRLSRAIVVVVVLLGTIVSAVLAIIFVLWSRGVMIQLEVQSPRRSEERRAAAYWTAAREFLRLGREFAHAIESRADASACREAALRLSNAADEWRKLHREAESPDDDYRQLNELILDRLAQAAALEDALTAVRAFA